MVTMTATTTSTSTTPVWAVRAGETILDGAGELFAIVKVDTDVAANGGRVALYFIDSAEGRVTFDPADEVVVVESLETRSLVEALLA